MKIQSSYLQEWVVVKLINLRKHGILLMLGVYITRFSFHNPLKLFPIKQQHQQQKPMSIFSIQKYVISNMSISVPYIVRMLYLFICLNRVQGYVFIRYINLWQSCIGWVNKKGFLQAHFLAHSLFIRKWGPNPVCKSFILSLLCELNKLKTHYTYLFSAHFQSVLFCYKERQ